MHEPLPIFLIASTSLDTIVPYVFLTLGYVCIASLISMLTDQLHRRLILQGLLTIVASFGYTAIVSDLTGQLIPVMVKTGGLLVVAGIVSGAIEHHSKIRSAEPSGRMPTAPPSSVAPTGRES